MCEDYDKCKGPLDNIKWSSDNKRKVCITKVCKYLKDSVDDRNIDKQYERRGQPRYKSDWNY